METNQCRLCHQSAVLRRSHIIPEFFYKPVYDEKHRARVADRRTGQFTFQQKGHREPLLCDRCEQLLNDRYERPFKRSWFDDAKLPRVPDFHLDAISGLDYGPFKLCLLSILWRASVSQQKTFEQVNLGPHEDPIRLMILMGDPGPPEKYPFATQILFIEEAETGDPYVVDALVALPVARRYEAHRGYVFMFGGCAWHFLVGSFLSEAFRELALTQTGELPILWQNLAQIELVQDFMEQYLTDGQT